MHVDGTRAVIDIETTGLNPYQDLILEIGVVTINRSLEETAAFGILVATTEARDWAARVRATAAEDGPEQLDVAQRMHLGNGLIEDLIRPNRFLVDDDGNPNRDRAVTTTLSGATDRIVDLLDRYGVPERVPLAGSSVRSLDGPFLSRHCPAIMDRFNHRTIDASALTEFARFVDPDGFTEISAGVARSGHRTVSDCRRSIEIMRRVRDHYGIGPAAVRR